MFEGFRLSTVDTVQASIRVRHGTLTRLALPGGIQSGQRDPPAVRREDREGQEAATTCDPTSRRWAPGEAAGERSLRMQRYSYVFEGAGETCRVEPA